MNKLIKLASMFENFVKHADLKQDLAKRILMGLSHHLGDVGNKAIVKFKNGDERQIDVLALRELISGAKNLLKYGIVACLEESLHARFANIFSKYIDYIDNTDHYENILKDLVSVFNDTNEWKSGFGGELWGKIASQLLKINDTLYKISDARKHYNYDEEAEELSNLMVEINIFEGLVHNTDNVLFKIHDAENKFMKPNFNEYYDNEHKLADDVLKFNLQQDKNRLKLERLMHAKELQDPFDTLNEILPSLRDAGKSKTRQQSGISQYIGKAEQLKKEDSSVDKEIEFIKQNRKFQILINDIKILVNKLKKIHPNARITFPCLISDMEVIFLNLMYYFEKITKQLEFFDKNNEIINDLMNRVELLIKDNKIKEFTYEEYIIYIDEIVDYLNEIIKMLENILSLRKFEK